MRKFWYDYIKLKHKEKQNYVKFYCLHKNR